jgi:predicted regulator of Ras-like GTPase activity (Roadblock/LC7/MglB family)
LFERFTEKAIRAIVLAQEEARRLGHNYVGSEQILLGLIGEGTGITARSLKGCGLNLKDARVEVEKIIGYGSGFVAVEIPFTVGSKRILELSWAEARQLGNKYIGTEHLLLAMLRHDDGIAIDVLTILGVDPIKLRRVIISALGTEPPEPPTASRTPEGQNKLGLQIDKDLMQILRMIRLAEQKAEVLLLPDLCETLRRHQVEMSNAFSRLGFNLQEDEEVPENPAKFVGAGLDNRPGVTGDVGLGRFYSIGKFSLEDLEKIGNIITSDLSDTQRWLTREAAIELQSLLQSVASQAGVIGSVVVGNDGLLIASTLPPEMDGEQIGVWALAVFMNTQNAAMKLGHDRVYQIVAKTPRGYIVIADFGSGLLVTVTDTRETDAPINMAPGEQ